MSTHERSYDFTLQLFQSFVHPPRGTNVLNLINISGMLRIALIPFLGGTGTGSTNSPAGKGLISECWMLDRIAEDVENCRHIMCDIVR